ncbi:hypothetical protein T459_07644 [Capsicum annuum]|uniref:YDG domain-containing protein n=1 Tax=Capsicum annuum TaxID=4072 RepID=A0A2G2ZU84_CAPAN|nr:hypothetical protein T459_07644 [Capsicum annuum]
MGRNTHHGQGPSSGRDKLGIKARFMVPGPQLSVKFHIISFHASRSYVLIFSDSSLCDDSGDECRYLKGELGKQSFTDMGAYSTVAGLVQRISVAVLLVVELERLILTVEKILQGEKSKSGKKDKIITIDLQAAKNVKEKGKEVNTGYQIPGEVGGLFQYRVEFVLVGVHHLYEASIDFMDRGLLVATSIFAAGAYDDDVGDAHELIYSGRGGNVVGKVKIPEDQKLVNERGKHGTMVFMFKLVSIPGQSEVTWREVQLSKSSEVWHGVCLHDITEGKESLPITAVNTIVGEKPPPFKFIKKMMYPVGFHPASPKGCDCIGRCFDPKRCSCAVNNGGEILYNRSKAIVEIKPLYSIGCCSWKHKALVWADSYDSIVRTGNFALVLGLFV